MIKFTVLSLAFFIFTVLPSQKGMAAPHMALSDAEVVPHKHWEVWVHLNYRDMEDQKGYKVPGAEQMQHHRSFSVRFCGPPRYRVSSASGR